MQVMVASDTVGSLSSARAGAAIGSGWAGADVRVLPIGEAGEGFVTAYADLIGAEVEADVEHGCLVSLAGTRGRGGSPGRGFRGGRTAAADRHVGAAGHGAGSDPRRPAARRGCSSTWRACPSTMPAPGCWPALGATADRPLDSGPEPLADLGVVDLSRPAAALAGVDLVGVVPHGSDRPAPARPAWDHRAGRSSGRAGARRPASGRRRPGPVRPARGARPGGRRRGPAPAAGWDSRCWPWVGGWPPVRTWPSASAAGVRAARASTWSSPVARSSTSPGAAGEWSRPRPSERRPRSAPAC